MSPDKLEKYILDHREQFDDLEPDPALWDKIDTPAAPVIRIHWKKIAWRAAAVAVIFTASYFFHDFMAGRNGDQQPFLAESAGEEGSPIVRELIEAEAYYTSMIEMRKNEVFRLTADAPDIQQEINMELIEMDKVFDELKEDLKDNADNTEVIEAMIQNYRLKLDILEEMLYRIRQSQQSQNEEENENASMDI